MDGEPMTSPLGTPGPPAAPAHPVHEPTADDRERRTRKRAFFWDRAKIIVILAVIFGFSLALKHNNVPIMSWGEVFRDQVRAKAWVLVLMGLELVRQAHYLISQRWGGYHQFWTRRVWGGWERFWSRRNPWLRYRLGRVVRLLAWFSVIMLLLSSLWGVSFVEAVAQAPKRLLYNPFGSNGFPWFFQMLYVLVLGMFQFVAIFWFLSRGGVEIYMPEDIKTRFSDVWGQDHVLEKVKENIVFLDKPEEIEKRGGHVPSGMLLWGPPGTGKTLMAEAVAGETGKPFVFVEPGAFMAMFFGVGLMKVRRLFKKLRKLALKYGGVIVFFDEADTLGNRGVTSGGFRREPATPFAPAGVQGLCNGLHYVSSATVRLVQDVATAPEPTSVTRRGFVDRFVAGMGGGGMAAYDGTLQALLTELSGLRKPRGFWNRTVRSFLGMTPKQPPKYRILTMMATNLPEALDAALLRPGRIDRLYHVNYPSLEGRIRTFRGYLDKVRHELTDDQLERLALMSPQASGAAIKDMVNEALIVATRNGRDIVTWRDVIEARVFKLHGMADSVASTRLEQWETALHEASHAVAGYHLRKRLAIDIATIEQRGPVGGFVSSVPLEERKFPWRSDWEMDVVCSLVSLAGERMFFGGDNSAGVGGDMRAATTVIRGMLTRAAMGDTLASHDGVFGGDGPETGNDLDRRVEVKLRELYQRAERLLEDNRWFVLAVAHALVSRRTITGEDIDAIYRGTRGATLDGSWYHDRYNRMAIERFHVGALAAHDEQSVNAELALPLLPALSLPPPPPLAGTPSLAASHPASTPWRDPPLA
jgi:ATP-dependent Zn protease